MLQDELRTHPDQPFVSRLLLDLRHGCRIGYTGPRNGHISPNLLSARSHKSIITEALQKEVSLGRLLGPFKDPPHPDIRCSGLGVVPKKSGGFRPIMHLSAPAGSSVNDFINKAEFSLRYATIDDAVRLIARHGRNALLCKVDLKSAFRLVPVHPEDWPLLGLFWDGEYFMDKFLPFGLRSSPALFNRLADALEYVLRNNGVEDLLHYLDDYFFAGPADAKPETSIAAIRMGTALAILDALDIPVADGDGKVLGPATEIPMLGILLDSSKWEMRLPVDKLAALQTDIQSWLERRQCTKRQLLSLVGSLSFAAKVVPPGRTFVRRLLDLAKSIPQLDTPFDLSEDARQDIKWWHAFLPTWNGRTFFHDVAWTRSPDLELYTDASGAGYGAVFGDRWFNGRWAPEQQARSIAWRELYPIALACRVWGEE